MFIGRKKIEIINEKDNIKKEVTYKKPEILMIDCDKEESDKLEEKGFNIELGTFGKKYKIIDQYGNKKVALNNKIGNIIEKDIVVIDMKQRNTNEEYNLEDLENLEDGTYITTHERQKEFNPINISSKLYINFNTSCEYSSNKFSTLISLKLGNFPAFSRTLFVLT